MSAANRVNVFLEKARMLSSSSPTKNIYASKSPSRMPSAKSPRVVSPMKQEKKNISATRTSAEPDLINNLENMIEEFLKSRYSAHEKIQNYKENEFRVIAELKETLDVEIEKSKANDVNNWEKHYKDKAEKVMMIVKQEAMNMDKKLVEIRNENSQLKQRLSEKNIEEVDKKIFTESRSINGILNRLCEKAEKVLTEKGRICIATLMTFKPLPVECAGLIKKIVADADQDLTPNIAQEIIKVQNSLKEFKTKFEVLLKNKKELKEKILKQIEREQERIDEQKKKTKIILEDENKITEEKLSEISNLDSLSHTDPNEIIGEKTSDVDSLNYTESESKKNAITDEKPSDLDVANADSLPHNGPESKVYISPSDILNNLYEEILDDFE